ncbi:uncharacterized protein SPPG_02831 [Spizellomyces punctatus DAOM BR117]|uniref:Nucleolar protein 12 n=1 Tax=Spizellomyces punctatus (strain DAOM BR117) TaxID=645134 RepID=A0A0L0HLQ5_SPIPD|nr:uncharacterized protein SPPG_02831 [Spizellomyces punctatus DAOM BR117]KND02361.1 hypothetical protein SPPG_02831 [Spizellomyces punctatus DAOM BR117]|eukprot:XP_016610400.1 hypothetical protein SPPG_02831 [Spizellomyces punctatus DAOM BR117]
MSGLSKALVGSAQLDKDLDALFGKAAVPSNSSILSQPATNATLSKRKKDNEDLSKKKKAKKEAKNEHVNGDPQQKAGRGKLQKKEQDVVEKGKGNKTSKREESASGTRKQKKSQKVAAEPTETEIKPTEKTESKKTGGKKSAKQEVKGSVEAQDGAKVSADKDTEDPTESLDGDVESESESGEDQDDVEDDKETNPTGKTRRQVKAEKLEKEERTIFVGNLPLSVTEKAGVKELKKLFSQYGNLKSIRFRSIARLENMPRKAAFITKNFHPGRDTLNAYIVYGEKESVEKALVENGKLFMGKHIRVDRSVKDNKHDVKRSVFVGALPFDINEEAVRAHFSQCGDIEYVRLIRDKTTNVGKGIGYVQFADRAAVGLAMKLHQSELEGRKIRVNRCKDVSPEAKKKRLIATEGTRAKKGAATGAGKIRSRPNKAKAATKGKPYTKPKRSVAKK